MNDAGRARTGGESGRGLASSYVSSQPWSDERPETLVICCSDGRYHPHLEEFAHHRVSERPDMIALPGGPAAIDAWASSFDHARVLAESLDLLLASHDLKALWLVSHELCSYYKRKHPALDESRLLRRQLDDLRRARDLVRERRPDLAVHLIHARVEGELVTFKELDAD
jgi:hypothetical protein